MSATRGVREHVSKKNFEIGQELQSWRGKNKKGFWRFRFTKNVQTLNYNFTQFFGEVKVTLKKTGNRQFHL